MNHLAECVGLWLAEGDSKTKSEITFTNNCWPLIELFSKYLFELFRKYKFRSRIYVYSKTGEKLKIYFPKGVIKYYRDARARKPYFIFRVASVTLVKEWANLVRNTLNNKKVYLDILRGFFAGEGNIKIGKHNNRTLRIAQKKPNSLVEKMFRQLGLSYKFYKQERSYSFTGKWNWDIFAQNKIADLHPDKKEKFWKNYKNFKEDHYPKLYLKKKIYEELSSPSSASDMALKFKRSQARISETLVKLKKEQRIKNFRVRSKTYWTKNKDLIIISDIKKRYLELLNAGSSSTQDIAKALNITWKAANKRLKELEKLGLVRKQAGSWMLANNKKEVIVL